MSAANSNANVVVELEPHFARDMVLLINSIWCAKDVRDLEVEVTKAIDLLVLRDQIGAALGKYVANRAGDIPDVYFRAMPGPSDELTGWARIEATLDEFKTVLAGNSQRGEIREEIVPALVKAIRVAQGTCALTIAGLLRGE